MKIIATPLQRLRQMPHTLALMTCVLTVLGLLVVVLAVSPFSGWNSEDGPVSYEDLWGFGGGFALLGAGVAMILFAWGFYRAQRWVRFALPLGFVLLTIYFALWPDLSFPYEWAGALFWAFLTYWYFNQKRKVVEYFSGARGAQPDGAVKGGQI